MVAAKIGDRESYFRKYVGDIGFVEGGEGEALLAEVVEGCARTLGRPTGLPSANLPSETQAFLRRIYVDKGCLVDDKEAVVELV